MKGIRARLKSIRREVSPAEASSRKEFAVFLFESTQGAIKAERVLLRAGLSIKLIPTPRQLSSDCGTALRCGWSDADTAIETLRQAKVAFAGVHRVPERI